ncbi:hypothetical protein COU58_01365 [Candidatus Pacearchaeota archaeon CG10_big_fil_rev_8_21_14_0_10_32_42]|nr:MAG: hypothetical protein COU58_01365 [Candidatus Pacearchaeota archaeon CG10_big_fil_rev_8_21_14_0_10_32_42]
MGEIRIIDKTKELQISKMNREMDKSLVSKVMGPFFFTKKFAGSVYTCPIFFPFKDVLKLDPLLEKVFVFNKRYQPKAEKIGLLYSERIGKEVIVELDYLN